MDINGRELSKKIKNEIKDEVDKLDMTGLLSNLVSQGIKINAIPVDGEWGEIDSQEDLALYQSLLDNGEM